MLSAFESKTDAAQQQIALQVKRQTGIEFLEETIVPDHRTLYEQVMQLKLWLNETQAENQKLEAKFGELIPQYFADDKLKFAYNACRFILADVEVSDPKGLTETINQLAYAVAYKIIQHKIVSVLISTIPAN